MSASHPKPDIHRPPQKTLSYFFRLCQLSSRLFLYVDETITARLRIQAGTGRGMSAGRDKPGAAQG